MRAAEYDLYIEQGVDWSQIFRFKDAEGDYIDLTDYVFRGQIRHLTNSEDVIVDFNFELLDQDDIVDGIGGVIISLTNTQTSAIPVLNSDSAKRRITDHCYDIEVVRPDDTVVRLLNGKAHISPEVTR